MSASASIAPLTRPFNSDPWCRATVRRLIGAFALDAAVETGTFLGATTRALAGWVPVVHTIEIDPRLHREARHRLADLGGVQLHLGDSAATLEALLPTLPGRLFVYLDAHWQARWPLRDELAALARHARDRAVICVDDFRVPGRPHAHDSYDGVANDLAAIADLLPTLGAAPRWFYNDRAAGPKPTGKLYIVPGHWMAPVADDWIRAEGDVAYLLDQPGSDQPGSDQPDSDQPDEAR